ncbi:MAG: phosphoribosylaminoimidazolesuccinocarboxamide synthase [Chitinophagaceae bacterium]|nr:phosphoribosylaminoimidazolesuccinocarboxamide synthase [Chitinophagaceae bacterium]
MGDFNFKDQTSFYRGKVRDVYTIGEDWLVMIASDRISAFDVILPRPIPYKGQVLNQIASHMLDATRDICPNWLINTPAPTVSIGKKCVPFKIEMVVRGYLTGHAWRTYREGKRVLCGAHLPEGMNENDPFPTPIITPSTKAEEGHDEDISPEEIIKQGLASEKDWEVLSSYALRLFERGSQIAKNRGLILVDTKYEFGKIGNEIFLMDEVHTPDSSRYFFSEGYDERQRKEERQPQLSKEFVRESWVETISKRYIELYEKVIGETFHPISMSQQEIGETIEKSLQQLKTIR